MKKSIESKLWTMLVDRNVSMAMIYNRKGQIFWHKGRKIDEGNINEGNGFPQKYLRETIGHPSSAQKKTIVVTSELETLSKPDSTASIKKLIIQPINEQFFLYIDSESKETITEVDQEIFRLVADLLCEVIQYSSLTKNKIDKMTGSSDAIGSVKEMLLDFAKEDEPVLILGETGVGKNLTAELIHQYSGRKGKFVVLAPSSINSHFFNETVFGCKEDFLADTMPGNNGLIAEAENGTLFIDEISFAPTSFYPNLLKLIETSTYCKADGQGEYRTNARVIVTSTKDLYDKVIQDEVSWDLYYRLKEYEILIPSLRDRKEDIKMFVSKNSKYLKGKSLGNGFWNALQEYHWPGNYRELSAVLKRAGIIFNSPITGDNISTLINK